MTSLAKQLQKLAIPGQPSLRQVVSKKRPSLLFDPEAAADIDTDTILSLGLNGLEELISIDQSFVQFETTIFQESYKEFERTVQTKEVLEDIDSQISAFLRNVSPYLLLRPAQKCLEWLIRSFRINSFNVDPLMECVLPYHETNLFARVLQLVPIKDPASPWHWLRPSQKAGSPLSKLTLTQHCISVPSFLVFLCEIVTRSLKALRPSSSSTNRALLGMYTSTVIGLMGEPGSVTEDLISRLLPYLIKGLKSSNNDFRASSYMIVSQLAARSSLESSLCSSLLEVIAKHLGPDLLPEGVSCVAVVCHTQQMQHFSKRALKHLIKCPSLVPVLAELAQSYYIAPLLRALLSSLVTSHCEGLHGDGDHDNDMYLTMIVSILDSIRLEEETVYSVLKDLFERFLEVRGQVELSEETVRSSVAPLVQSLDAKYPRVMDRAIEETIAAPPPDMEEVGGADTNQRIQYIQQLLTLSLPNSRHQVMSDVGSTLALSVYHHSPTMRAAAVRQMAKSISSLQKESVGSSGLDVEFISSSLLARLGDDDPTVVAAVFSIKPKLLFKVLPEAELVPSLLALLRKKRLHKLSPAWQEVTLTALQILLSPSMISQAPGFIDDIIVTVIPLLFTGRHSNVLARRVGEVIVQSALGLAHPVLCDLRDTFSGQIWQAAVTEGTTDPMTLASGCEVVFGCVGQQLAAMEPEDSHSLLSKMLSTLTSSSPDQMAYYALLCSLGSCARHMTMDRITTQLHLAWYLLEHVWRHLLPLPPEVPAVQCGGLLAAALQPLMLKHPSRTCGNVNVLMWVMKILTDHLLIPDTLSTAMWLEVPRDTSCLEDLYYQVVLSLFSLVTSLVERGVGVPEERGGVAAVAGPMLQTLSLRHFWKPGTFLRFLAMIWTTPTSADCQSWFHSSARSQFPFDELPHSHFKFQVTPVMQVTALSIAAVYIKGSDGPAAMALLGNVCPVVPSLLFPLMSPVKVIRHSAISCLLSLFNATQGPPQSEPLPFLHLVNLLCTSQLELTTDPASLVELFHQICIKEDRATLAKSKRRQSRKSTKSEERPLGLACVEGVLSHVVMFGMPPHIQMVLLQVLVGFDHQVKLVACSSLLTALLSNKGGSTVYDQHLLQLAVSSFTPKMAPMFDSDNESFQLLLSLLKTEALGDTCPQAVAVAQVTPEFFSSLEGPGLRQATLQTMIDVLVSCERASTSALFKQHLTRLPLSAKMICTELTLHSDRLGGAKPPPTPGKKSRRSKAPPTTTPPANDSDGVPLPWKRVIVILELLQQSLEFLTDPHLLVPDLFNLLNRCLDREADQRQRLEYTQQLLLSTLLEVLTLLGRGGVESAREYLQEEQFNVELVVQCVRLSLNPQTHHHALLLLSSAAAIFPGPVLHNIMPIFTFMGASVLRHDDQYSFKIITRTIDSVIPALIKSGPALLTTRSTSSRSKPAPPTSVEGVVREIVQVFVDSLPHVPDHRRLPLLTHLLTSVGVEEHLHVVLGLMVERQVVADESTVEMDQSFPILLTQQFSPTIQLTAMFKLTQYLTQLPQEKPKTSSKLRQLPAASSALFNIAAHSDRQLRRFRSSSLTLLLSLLSNKEFISKMVTTESVEGVVLKLLQSVLSYSLTLNKIKSATPHQETSYWQGLINKTLSLTDKVISLLSPQAFLDIVSQLVTEETVVATGDLQRKALEIFNKRLEENKMKFTSDHDSTMLELVDLLMGVASQSHTPPVTRQTALYGVKLLCRKLASKHHKHFIKTTRSILSLLTEGEEGVHSQVLSSCLLCVAECCSSLGPHSIPLLPSILPPILAPLGQAQEISDLLQLSAVTALGVIVRTLPNFLSSYVNDIITKLCHPSLTCGESVDLIKEASLVRQGVSQTVHSRVLLPAYLKCYPAVLLHGNSDCVVALLSMLSRTIEHMSKDEVKGHSSLLLNVFTTVLDYRATQDGHMSLVAIETVEGDCMHAFTVLVVKLSESLFRPMFIQLLDWATQTSAPRERLITFYHLADSAAGKLKNLFLLFAGHFVKNVTTLLTAIHEDGNGYESLFSTPEEDMVDLESDPVTKSCVLLGHILHCLTKCFMYDRGGNFLTKERFDAFMQPLVNQVSNTLGGSESFSNRIESCLVPCLSHFAVSAGKDSLWKPLNYQLLLKTKHSNSEVRFAALKVLQDMYLKLGEEFMVLLPETIPFLAECMEDDCEEVEQLTQSVVNTIEQILGETIQQYF